MKCIIAEDEFLVRQSLRSKITRLFPDVDVVAETDYVSNLIELIEHWNPDVVLLDISFPDGNSLDVLRNYSGFLPYIIFITSYPHFALEAIRLDAVDYLLKPVEDVLLEKAFQKCKRYLEKERTLQQIPQIIRPDIPEPRKIMIPSQTGYYLLEIGDIIRMTADVNYTRIYVKEKPPILVAITLKYFEAALKEMGFFRVHKSHLVNVIHIERYQKTTDGGQLTLIDETVVPLSRNVRSEFHQVLQAQVISMGTL